LILGSLSEALCAKALVPCMAKRIVCEHTQHAFDSGPRLSADQSLESASHGFDLDLDLDLDLDIASSEK
jgi:hypothetical protein